MVNSFVMNNSGYHSLIGNFIKGSAIS